MRKLFGTDGIRGVANVELTADLALELGRAVVGGLELPGGPKVLIGRDTRASGPMLEAGLTAGLLAAGAHVVHAGVIPTPAVAYLVTELGFDIGAVISASHNPAPDNGIKFFGAKGYKLTDEQEAKIESLLGTSVSTGTDVGDLTTLEEASDLYVEHVLRCIDEPLDGLKVVVDCANGAAFRTTPSGLEKAGAEVIVRFGHPDGANINDGCGSTHPDLLIRAVLETGADVGLAHDGDADRVIAVDENGDLVDGDAMMAALAIRLQEEERLTKNVVVTTVMANLGFHKAMKNRGIRVVETPVGDRYVLESMLKEGATLGGEQSGHVIFSEYSTTGDGLITGLRLLSLVHKSGRRLSELASVVERYPQVLQNVEGVDRSRLDGSRAIWDAVREAESALGDSGRVLVRASGTEPLVRVMVEAPDRQTAESVATSISEVVRTELGAKEVGPS